MEIPKWDSEQSDNNCHKEEKSVSDYNIYTKLKI